MNILLKLNSLCLGCVRVWLAHVRVSAAHPSLSAEARGGGERQGGGPADAARVCRPRHQVDCQVSGTKIAIGRKYNFLNLKLANDHN